MPGLIKGQRLPARAAIAATSVLALGGSLAVGVSAAGAATPVKAAPGVQFPLGSLSEFESPAPTPYPGFGPAANLAQFEGSFAAAAAAAANELAQAGDPVAQTINTASPAPWNPTTNPWTEQNINAYNAMSTTPPAGQTSGAVQAAADFLHSEVGAAIAETGNYVSKLKSVDPTYGADVTQMRNLANVYAGGQFLMFATLVPGAKAAYPGHAYSVNGDMSVSSTATVTKTTKPAAYSLTMATSGAAAASATAGYVDPLGETVSFPRGWHLNLAILKDEIPHADIANPASAGKKPIGTLTIHSPDIGILLNNAEATSGTGEVYLVRSANPRVLLPQLELAINTATPSEPIVVIGHLSGTTFPLKVRFSTPIVPLDASLRLQEPVPFSSLTVSFPAKTSPYVIPSCRAATAPVATMTDGLGSIAPYFGDYADGDTIGTPVAPTGVSIPSSRTKVTNHCRR